MKLDLAGYTNGYAAVEDAVLSRYAYTGESIVVELRTKYSHEKTYAQRTELLLNDGPDFLSPLYVWENDWWEGEQDIELVAAAPISRVRLSKEHRYERSD